LGGGLKILIVGGGKAGSWQMRGVQLGHALGARVSSELSTADLAWADVVVLVKRAALAHCDRVRAAGKPIVWDALDFWSQPRQNGLTAPAAVTLLDQQIARIRPSLVIGATEAMAQACGGICLPHHGYLTLEPAEARTDCRAVAYDGNALYLDRWAEVLRQACHARGWTFLVNPPDLRAADILVSLRGGPWDGWICRQWKSGVKIANAVLAGRPILTQDGAAAREIPHAGSIVETPADLSHALDTWSGWLARHSAVEQCREWAPQVTVEAMAARYRGMLAQLPRP
jgi:hypothetical protein